MDFSTLASLPDDRIDILTGALLLARDEYPTLDLDRERRLVDSLAAPLGRLDGLEEEDQALLLAERLFGEQGFRGNSSDYYDPRNSFLNDVLERRLGIPITLSILYTEVARRTGVPASGVAFPGHFLVRIETEHGEPLFVDPFREGRILGKPTLRAMLERSSFPRGLDRKVLEPASPRAVLLRMLNNLKGIYTSRGEWSRLLVVLSRAVELAPHSANEYRERGLVAMRLGAPEVAKSDFHRYLELSPEAMDAVEIRRIVGSLTDRRAVLS